MARSPARIRRTDIGTIVLHWVLVITLVFSVGTGLRIAMDSPEHAWLVAFDAILPLYIVWTRHIPAAVILVAVSLAYVLYMRYSGLMSRIRLDWPRLKLLVTGRGQVRWGAVNVVLYWVLFVTMIMEVVTGGLLWFGWGRDIWVRLHMLGTWIILGYAAMHIMAHFVMGGAVQLLRVFRPSKLAPPPPPFDPLEMLQTLGAGRGPARPPQPRRAVFLVNPFLAAAAAAVAGITVSMEWNTAFEDTLYIRRIDKAEAPIIDGDVSDPVWRHTPSTTMYTALGGNLDGKGESAVEIRAVHDEEWAYFCFMWDDPTRSLKHLPLVKRNDGWHVLHDRYDRGDERSYFEDKFSVLLTKVPLIIPGDRTYHSGPTPIADKPSTLSERGLHFTPGPGLAVEVWQWKASSGGLLGWIDKNHFDVPVEPTYDQVSHKVPYRGGFIQDPRTAELYADNFDPQPVGGYERPIQPRRLPKDWKATYAALGRINLDPDEGDTEGSRWWMTLPESEPYSAEIDAQIPVGVVIPGSLILVDDLAQRADVKGAARWGAGKWTLEVARRLDAKAPDVPLGTGTYMRVSVFDHAQIYHTRHIRPIRIEMQ
jgi:hypothetical protein